MQIVEALTGVYIDHYSSLDFNGFKDMVDAVDGVKVCIPKDVDDPEHDIFFDRRHPDPQRHPGPELRARALPCSPSPATSAG